MPDNILSLEDTTHGNNLLMPTSSEGATYRPRKKHIYDQILKQLEFYLGDANLSKDRFLSQKLQENPQLPVELFLTFNKIRNLTLDVKDLVIALKKSNLLELTEDESKVFRKTQVRKRENQDECTIYVENLPSEAEHEWLTKIFVNYGNVLYVSIPKFKNSHQNKGFAFIEFDSPDCVTKVLEAFGSAGCRLSANMPSDQLLSIKTFEDDEGKSLYHNPNEDSKTQQTNNKLSEGLTEDIGEQKAEKRKRLSTDQDSAPDVTKKTKQCESETGSTASNAKTNVEAEQSIKEEICDNPQNVTSNTEKRKRLSSGEESGPVETKKLKQVEPEVPTSERSMTTGSKQTLKEGGIDGPQNVTSKTVVCVDMKAESIVQDSKQLVQQGGSDIEHDTSDEEGGGDEKNIRSKCRKNKKADMKNRLEVSSLGLQVLSKREWKRLRNKYLNLQREKMGLLKRQARLLALQEHQRKMAEEEQKEKDGSKSQKNGKGAPNYEYTSGVILKYEPEDFIQDVVKFKVDARNIQGVAYIDIVPERKDVFIRCETAEKAASILASKVWENCRLLQGAEEIEYWQKIEEDRAAKFDKKREKERGRNKLLHRIKKLGVEHSTTPINNPNVTGAAFASSTVQRQHIRFGDDEEVEAPKVEPTSNPASEEVTSKDPVKESN